MSTPILYETMMGDIPVIVEYMPNPRHLSDMLKVSERGATVAVWTVNRPQELLDKCITHFKNIVKA